MGRKPDCPTVLGHEENEAGHKEPQCFIVSSQRLFQVDKYLRSWESPKEIQIELFMGLCF